MIKQLFIISVLSLLIIIQMFAQTDHKIVIDEDIQLIHLRDSVFIHISWHQMDNYGRFPSNGLIVIKNGQALMIDTPMDNSKTERLTQYLRDSLKVKLSTLIAGHFHNDCIGGLEYLQDIGVESIANSMTVSRCRELELPVPSIPFTDSLIFNFEGETIECRYFGAGHSTDNIVVWIPNKKILFGGCLVRSIDSKGLGNLSDAVVNDWDFTIKKLMKNYPIVETVIPGHGNVGGPELLTHTIELVQAEKKK